MRYSVQPRDRIKGYGFLLFAKNTNKIIGKNVKYIQIVFDHAKQFAADVFKTDGNKIPYKMTKISKNSQQSNSETVTYENDKEIPKKRYISPEEKQKNIDDLRLI